MKLFQTIIVSVPNYSLTPFWALSILRRFNQQVNFILQKLLINPETSARLQCMMRWLGKNRFCPVSLLIGVSGLIHVFTLISSMARPSSSASSRSLEPSSGALGIFPFNVFRNAYKSFAIFRLRRHNTSRAL